MKKLLLKINLDFPLFIEKGIYEFMDGMKTEFGVDNIITTYENGGLLSFYAVSELPPEANEEVEIEPTGGCPHSGSPVSGILYCDSMNNKNIDVVIKTFCEIEEGEENFELEFKNREDEGGRDCIEFYEDTD